MSTPLNHDQFTIERVYRAPRAKVFHALTDPDLRAKWFIAPKNCVVTRRELDLRVGGLEYFDGRFPNMETTYKAEFFHIEPDRSMVYTYNMHLNSVHHSLSLASVELFDDPAGTRLVYRETIAFFDGTESAKGRQGGVGWHFRNLDALLSGEPIGDMEMGTESDAPCPHTEGVPASGSDAS
jgi:uncharacterized protein YndB with AHSA1/START domain